MSKIITIFAGGKSGECVERYRREYREGLIKLCNFLRKGEARKKWWRMDLDPANMGGEKTDLEPTSNVGTKDKVEMCQMVSDRMNAKGRQHAGVMDKVEMCRMVSDLMNFKN